MWRLALTKAVAIPLLVAAPAVLRAQADRSDEKPAFAASAHTVRVAVSVLDRSQQPVRGLLGSDFRIWENGRRQKVTLFSSERQPMRIALALDVSESMADKIDRVEEALNHFIDILEPEDEILVLAFNRQVRLLQDFTSDRDLLGDALSTVQTYGGTALYAAAYQAIERVARAPVESRAVVLVSDGVNTEAGVTFDELLALAQWSGVPVFSIGLDGRDRAKSSPDDERSRGGRRGDPGGGGKPGNGGSGNFGGPRRRPPGHGPGGGGQPSPKPQRFDQKVLEKLANETGGRAEVISGPERYTPGEGLSGGGRLRLAVELIALTLRHRYLLGYEPSEERTGWRTIRVEVDRPEGATAKAGKGYLVER